MRTWILLGLATGVLALTAMPGTGAAQLFNSTKKDDSQAAPGAAAPAPNTAKSGNGGGSALFNSGQTRNPARPLFLDPSLRQNNTGGKTKPFTQMREAVERSNSGFKDGADSKSQISRQDAAIALKAQERLALAAARKAEVRAIIDESAANAKAREAANGVGTVVPTAGQTAPEPGAAAAAAGQKEPAKAKPSGPMVYDGNKKQESPRRLFGGSGQ